jgi:hypothetical protein
MALAATKTDPTPAPRKTPTVKICRTCKTPKAYKHYAKHGSSRDKHRHVCKSCVSNATKGRNKPQRVTKPKAAQLPAKPYEPTEIERAVLDRYHDRKKQQPAPPLRVAVADGVARISPDHPDLRVGSICSMAAVGTASESFFEGLISQVVSLGSDEERGANFGLALLYGIKPRDEAEALLGIQMMAVLNAGESCAAPGEGGQHRGAKQRVKCIQQVRVTAHVVSARPRST